jgi:serine kinase of HPr protein (carbohydrate metabolism regulator)
VPKIKDLVNAPAQKYENMFNIISKSNSEPILSANISANINTSSINNEYTLTDLLPKQETTSDMKNELKNFLKKQMNSTINVNNTTSITALDSMMSNSVSYSEFT